MSFNLQPDHLQNELVSLFPLRETDLELLYPLAADPLVWEQHPNPNRYQRQVFETYFRGAMASNGAFIIKATQTGDPIGCTRFYDYNEDERQVLIGYTFFGRAYWGKGFNPAVKKLMLEYAFKFVDKVIFHVGADNKRSRIAMERLGAINSGMEEVAYFGEPPKTNVVYVISRST